MKDDRNAKKILRRLGIFSASSIVLFADTLGAAAMDYAVIRYQVRSAGLDENRSLIRKVFEELEHADPEGFRYLVLELEGGQFVHIVGTPDHRQASPLTELAAFKTFTERHGDRRSTPVVRSAARVVGNFQLLAAEPPHA
jgi:hypothetical protein